MSASSNTFHKGTKMLLSMVNHKMAAENYGFGAELAWAGRVQKNVWILRKCVGNLTLQARPKKQNKKKKTNNKCINKSVCYTYKDIKQVWGPM